jgi:hypothetical protein
MAASLIGDVEKVRLTLRCPHDEFRAYCAGTKELPYDELDRLIDLISREQGLLIARNRELLAHGPRR